MKEATAHMHRHSFEWRPDITPGVETIQTLACTTGCNTTRGTRVAMPSGGIFTYEGGIITGGQPDEDGLLIIPARINGVNITTINERAFIGSAYGSTLIRPITSLEICEGITTIGDYAFSHNYELTSVTLPTTLLHIGEHAFRNSNILTNITIPDNVLTIGESAFHYCRVLESITIPESVISIGQNAFRECYELATVRMLPITPPELGGWVFSGTPADLKIYVPSGSVEAYKAATNWNAWASIIVEASP